MVRSLIAALAFSAAGCGLDLRGLCEAQETCVGGNEADIDACVAVQQYDVDVADIEGCTDEHEAYFTCLSDEATCLSDDTGMACTDIQECLNAGYASCKDGTCRAKVFGLMDPAKCEAELNAYKNCQ